VILLILACLGGRTEIITIEDEGSLCWNSGGNLEIDFDQCRSSSCDSLLSSECSAELFDGVLEVSGTASIESQIGGTCTADCGVTTAICELPSIDDPDAVVVSYGGVDTVLSEIPDCWW